MISACLPAQLSFEAKDNAPGVPPVKKTLLKGRVQI